MPKTTTTKRKQPLASANAATTTTNANNDNHRVDVPSMMQRLVEELSQDELARVQQRWSRQPLRVATVCSGTDAPILALEWLFSAINNNNNNTNNDNNNQLQLEHVFSCENVPFKRTFLTATTNPPLLFTDVTELANHGKGTCHDGTVRDMPTNTNNTDAITMLMAGTECVDFSSLSTSPKGLTGGGRSDVTFWATLQVAQRLQPPVVLLENVAQCPADEMKRAYENIGYVAVHHKVCTSDYMLPQSRRRAYFLFVHKTKAKYIGDWNNVLDRLGPQRTVSPEEVPLKWTDCLWPEPQNDTNTNHHHNHQPKKKPRGKPLAQSLTSKWLAEITKMETDEHLTPYDQPGGRPYTNAMNHHHQHLAALPDRAKMRLDVQCKRAIQAGIDPFVTPLLWNPAQQLRFTDAGFVPATQQPKPLAPCVTPKHEWIVSARQAPLTGRECLALQGMVLPEEPLLSSGLDDKQLRDLAGNAMSTTVVAAACLACFVTCELQTATTTTTTTGTNHGSPEAAS